MTELRQASEAVNREITRRANALEQMYLEQRRLRVKFCELVHAVVPGSADPDNREAQRAVRQLADALRQRGVDLSAVAMRWAGTPPLPSIDQPTDGGSLFNAEPAARAEDALR